MLGAVLTGMFTVWLAILAVWDRNPFIAALAAVFALAWFSVVIEPRRRR